MYIQLGRVLPVVGGGTGHELLGRVDSGGFRGCEASVAKDER